MRQLQRQLKPLPLDKKERISQELVLQRVARVLRLPEIHSIQISGDGIAVERYITGLEQVWPDDETDYLNYDHIYRQLHLEPAKCPPTVSPTGQFAAAAEQLGDHVVGFMAPMSTAIAMFFNLRLGMPEALFGYRIVYGGDPELNKLILVGGPTPYWTTATKGVVISMESA